MKEAQRLQKEYDASSSKGEPTRELLLMFQEIAKRCGNRIDAKCRQDVDSCVSYALTKAWQKWDRFNAESGGNPLAFFTKMIKGDMFRHYKKITRDRHIFVSIDALFSNSHENY